MRFIIPRVEFQPIHLSHIKSKPLGGSLRKLSQKILLVTGIAGLMCTQIALAGSISAQGFNNLDDANTVYENLATLLTGEQTELNANFKDLNPLSDHDLRDVQGQALFDISQRTGTDGTQFLRMLFNASIETNLNINKLRLGPTGNEDISIDKFSISGGAGPNSYATLTRPFLELAISDFSNASNKKIIGLRVGAEDIVGTLGFGEQDATAYNPTSQCAINGAQDCLDSGINVFSGYMKTSVAQATLKIGEIKLQGYINARAAGTLFDPGDGVPISLTQYIYPDTFLSANDPQNSFADHRDNNNFWSQNAGDTFWFTAVNESHGRAGQQDDSLQGMGRVLGDSTDFGGQLTAPLPATQLAIDLPSVTLSGSKQSSITMNLSSIPFHTIVYADPANWEGTCSGASGVSCADNTNLKIYSDGSTDVAYTDNFLAALVTNVSLRGTLYGVTFDSEIVESLRFVHKAEMVGGGGTFLSVQSENIRWPNSIAVSNQGYSMIINNPIPLGDLGILPKAIYLDESAYRDMEVAVERGLLTQAYPELAGALFGIPVNIGDIDLGLTIVQNQNSLPLGLTQKEPNNCYGGIDCF